VNNIATRGRRLGLDVLQRMQMRVPVDLVGINSEHAGGSGEVVPRLLPYEIARHRFVFNPIRYTSLGLAICEAMMVGAPVVGLATKEMAVAVESGVTGFVHTDVDRVADFAEELLRDYPLASRLSACARERARERHGIDRFAREWDALLRELAGRRRSVRAAASENATPLSPV
jgi:glycosyltransferase involved in cell wall biosynthesis